MPPLETLARQFDIVAFSSEYNGGHRRGRLIKWTGPIAVRLEGSGASAFRSDVEAHVAELRRLSGLNIAVVSAENTDRPGNIVLEFSHSRGGTRFERDAPCRTLIYDRDFVIYRAQIYVAPDPPELRRHCIIEELTQALGLANDSTLIADSIFNDASRRQTLPPWDALMVRVLYDPRLLPGMTREVARPIVGEILRLHTGNRAAPH